MITHIWFYSLPSRFTVRRIAEGRAQKAATPGRAPKKQERSGRTWCLVPRETKGLFRGPEVMPRVGVNGFYCVPRQRRVLCEMDWPCGQYLPRWNACLRPFYDDQVHLPTSTGHVRSVQFWRITAHYKCAFQKITWLYLGVPLTARQTVSRHAETGLS